jgi:hypothetical protein
MSSYVRLPDNRGFVENIDDRTCGFLGDACPHPATRFFMSYDAPTDTFFIVSRCDDHAEVPITAGAEWGWHEISSDEMIMIEVHLS